MMNILYLFYCVLLHILDQWYLAGSIWYVLSTVRSFCGDPTRLKLLLQNGKFLKKNFLTVQSCRLLLHSASFPLKLKLRAAPTDWNARRLYSAYWMERAGVELQIASRPLLQIRWNLVLRATSTISKNLPRKWLGAEQVTNCTNGNVVHRDLYDHPAWVS